MIQKEKHNNYEQEHEMCKTNIKMNQYYANICKHEHEKNMTRLWCKIMPSTNVEQLKQMRGHISIYTPFGT
jgi:hypothetical protein